MAGYHCKVCNETASSKCVASRNVFPSNQRATLIGNSLYFSREDYYKRTYVPKLNVAIHASGVQLKGMLHDNEVLADKDEATFMATPEYRQKLIDHTVDMLKSLVSNEVDLRTALCDHEWVLDSPTCDLGCCSKKGG